MYQRQVNKSLLCYNNKFDSTQSFQVLLSFVHQNKGKEKHEVSRIKTMNYTIFLDLSLSGANEIKLEVITKVALFVI